MVEAKKDRQPWKVDGLKFGKPARPWQGNTGFPFHRKGVLPMDVPNSQNVTDIDGSVPSIKSTTETGEINTNLKQKTNESGYTKMHVCITFFVLGLLLLIVVYGLFKQIYWLVGLVSVRVILSGVGKIFHRYL
jgi:hypothetical protein